MKIFVCLFFFAVIATTWVVSNGLKEKWRKFPAQCANETKISEESLDKVINPGPTDDVTLKAYTLCLFKKMEIVGEDGTFNKENFKNMLLDNGVSGEDAERLVKKCSVKKDRPEETAYDGFVCWSKNGTVV
ncbi:hypothetical protein Zmor_027247 [Zophobas morio]|uniref:Uncharacterized protein n=1 Tax=Zophobas morio TaxID=2755281 RepID=A0AA38M367_9CUCU|nr:hypothetical protein Zmor_027247 [Zophobas morio]